MNAFKIIKKNLFYLKKEDLTAQSICFASSAKGFEIPCGCIIMNIAKIKRMFLQRIALACKE